MVEVNFDHPVPESTEQEDPETIADIAEGIQQLQAGQGIPIEQLRKVLATTKL